MATRPAAAKKAPAKKPAAKKSAAVAACPNSTPPAPKAKPVAAPVVTLKAVFEQLGDAHGLPKKQAHALLADFVAAMTTHLKQGDRVRMSGLGILEVKSRAARAGRTRQPVRPFRSRPPRRWAFGRPKSSRRPSRR